MSDNLPNEFCFPDDPFDWDLELALGVESNFQSSYNMLSLNESTDASNTVVAECTNSFLAPGEALSLSEVNDLCSNSELDDHFLLLHDSGPSAQSQLSLSSGNSTDVDGVFEIIDELQSNHALLDTEELRSDSSQEQAIHRIEKQLQSGTELLPQYQTDEMHLQEIDKSLRSHHCSMTIRTQPPNDRRFRYKSDGKRQLERSRSEPMAIDLLGLKECRLNPNQSLWIRLVLITTNNNPKKKPFMHANILEYHADDAKESDNGLVRVPLTKQDIESGVKKFPRLSIIGKKRDDYTFDLIPVDSPLTNGFWEKYTTANEKNKTKAAKAKKFVIDYDLSSCHILCQLMIKQNETWYLTDIACKTEVITEKKQVKKSTNSVKRSTLGTDDELELGDSEDAPISNAAKRQKLSFVPMNGLPVTYASTNQVTESDRSS